MSPKSKTNREKTSEGEIVKTVEVVAALLRRESHFFICQRPANKARPLQWEFPGGKIEPGESPCEALIRECREELAIEIDVGDLFAETSYSYPDLKIRLRLYNATIAEGKPQKLEHHDMRWITPRELPNYTFCPADLDFVQRLAKE